MPVILVLTATSPDKPGLIDLLSTTLAAHGANWQHSRMATLGGQFAGLLQASGDGRFIEVQGTAEREPFTRDQMESLLGLAAQGIQSLAAVQREAIAGANS